MQAIAKRHNAILDKSGLDGLHISEGTVATEKLDKLKEQAEKACEFRGHKMGSWINTSETHAYCYCLNEPCKAEVGVNNKPMPNEIDVGGDAVALTCPVT